MNKLLDVKELKVDFSSHGKKIYAVSGASFSLYEGETLGIVGESGCGKSATAKAITKLLPPHTSSISGEILYGDKNLLEYSENQMQKVRGKEIGIIFQDPMTSLNPTLRIGTQIIEGYKRHHPEISKTEGINYAIKMLELVGIPQATNRVFEYPHTLSGGMRQRVMIAIALACRPKILIADEPTTALDVTIQAQILKLMKEIQEKTSTSILLITHDLSVIAGFCDRVIVMYAGKVVETGSAQDIFYRPQHPYTKRLLQSIPKINLPSKEPLVSIEGMPPQLTEVSQGCSFAARCPSAMKICLQKNPSLTTTSPGHTSSCWLHQKEEK
jgi:oligopeptide/dipeptide ABC transporter ATP-binding protein